ncbi:MAG: hypothetical protein ACXW3U_09495 [Rhodoplanes sp.]
MKDYNIDIYLAEILGMIPLGQKIEAQQRELFVGRCAAIGMMQQRIADLPIFVLDCCESRSQKQAQLKVGAFEPQPSVYQN